MKYKVGDRVKIKSDLDMQVMVTYGMGKFAGEIMTIQQMICNGAVSQSYKTFYKMQEDGGEWFWHEHMIEGLAEPEPKKPTMTEVYQMAIDTYGEDEQCRMIQEEMDELGVALSKWHRKPSEDTLAQVQEEIADVCIRMQQAKLMFGEKDIDTIIIEKADRLYDRLKDDQTVEVVSGKHKINGNTYTWINPDKVKVEIGGIAIADIGKGHTPIIVVGTWPEKLKDVKHHRKIICAGGLSDE